MPSSVAHPAAVRHPALPDTAKAGMAKAYVRIPDVAWQERIGRSIARAVATVGWSHKEAAAAIGVDDAEFGKWLSGTRRPQFDRLFAIQELRQPLLIALASLVEDVEVVTEIRMRRLA